jgi:hypothetical protein
MRASRIGITGIHSGVVMIEHFFSNRGVPMKGTVLGYESDCKLHIAALTVDTDRIVGCEFHKFHSPHDAVAHFVERPRPLGIGVHDTLAYGPGREGWRPADFWIDEAPFYQRDPHDEFPFYWGPFQSTHSVNGLALLLAMRKRWPELPASETSPNDCCRHLNCSSKWPSLKDRIELLARWMKMDLQADVDEHQWHAAMSAFAMRKGLRGDWTIDLHRLTREAGEGSQWTSEDGEEAWLNPALSYDALLFPAGPVAFYWPPDERA